MNKLRIRWVDIVKGLAIGMVVFTHINDSAINTYLEYIDLAAFFFVAGVTFKNTSFLKIMKSLLLPYLAYSLILLVIFVCLNYHSITWASLKSILVGIGYARYYLKAGDPVIMYIANSPLWFLPALLIVKLVAKLLVNLSPRQLFLPVLLLTVLGWLIKNQLNLTLAPWSIDIALISLPLFYAGMFYKKVRLNNKYINPYFFSLLLMIFVVFVTWAGGINIALSHLCYSPVLYYIASVLGISLVVFLAHYLDTARNQLAETISTIGRFSLVIMGFHLILIELVNIGNLVSVLAICLFIVLLGGFYQSTIKFEFSK